MTHGDRDEIVPLAISESFAAAARAAGDDVELVVAPGEDHFGHLDPAQPAVGGGDGVADPLSRAAARGGRRRRSAGRLPRALRRGRRRRHLPRRQLARPAAGRDPRAAGRGSRTNGASGSSAAGRTGSTRPTRAGDALARADRRRPGEVLVCDSTTVNLLQARRRGAWRGARRARHRPRQLPHRPLRARGARGPARPRAAPSTASPTRRRSRAGRATSSCSRTSTTAPARSPTSPALQAAADASAARRVIWDLSHSAGRDPGRPARRRRGARRRLHLQVPQRRAGRARVPLRRARAPGGAALADLGLVRPARPVRDGARLRPRRRRSAASSPARRRSSASPPSRRASRLTAEAGIAALPPRRSR